MRTGVPKLTIDTTVTTVAETSDSSGSPTPTPQSTSQSSQTEFPFVHAPHYNSPISPTSHQFTQAPISIATLEELNDLILDIDNQVDLPGTHPNTLLTQHDHNNQTPDMAESSLTPPCLSTIDILNAARALTQALHITAQNEKELSEFGIKGSTALAVYGVDVTPADIDVITHNVTHTARATQLMGYSVEPSGSHSTLHAEQDKPQIDVLYAPDWGETLTDTRLINGIRVKSKEALLVDLELDQREEKLERNQMAKEVLERRIQQEATMQMVPFKKTS